MSAAGIPQLSIVHGICVAGGAYVPALSDETIIVRRQGTIFLAGPPLVKAATGEVVDDEALGGGEMHTAVSGVADHLAADDEEALVLMRKAVRSLNWQGRNGRRGVPVETPKQIDPPAYDEAELHGIVGTNLRQGFEMREVIARIVDGSRVRQFRFRAAVTPLTLSHPAVPRVQERVRKDDCDRLWWAPAVDVFVLSASLTA